MINTSIISFDKLSVIMTGTDGKYVIMSSNHCIKLIFFQNVVWRAFVWFYKWNMLEYYCFFVFIFLRNPYANAIFSRYCIDISTICPFSHFVAALWQGCVITQCSFLYVFQDILNVIIPCSKYHLVLSEVRVIMFIYIYLFFLSTLTKNPHCSFFFHILLI